MRADNLHFILYEELTQGLPPVLSTSTLSAQWLLLDKLRSHIARTSGIPANKILSNLSKNPTKKLEVVKELAQISWAVIGESPMPLPLWLNIWVVALAKFQLLQEENGSFFTFYDISLNENGNLHIVDTRDNEDAPYFAPKPVTRKSFKYPTGKTVTIEEGKNKTQRQLLQEAIFEVKYQFVTRQLHAILPDESTQKQFIRDLRIALAEHVYYTLDSDFNELAKIPTHFPNIKAYRLADLPPISELAWLQVSKNIAQSFTQLKQIQASLPFTSKLAKQTQDLKTKLLNNAQKFHKKYAKLQNLKTLYDQNFGLQGLFEVELSAEEAADKERAKGNIAILTQQLQADLNWDWAVEFPNLTDEEGLFKGFDEVLFPIHIENLAIANQVCQPKGELWTFLNPEICSSYEYFYLRRKLLEKQIISVYLTLDCTWSALNFRPISNAQLPFKVINSEGKWLENISSQSILEQKNVHFFYVIKDVFSELIRKIEYQHQPLKVFGEIIGGISPRKKDIDSSIGIPLLDSNSLASYEVSPTNQYFNAPEKLPNSIINLPPKNILYLHLSPKGLTAASSEQLLVAVAPVCWLVVENTIFQAGLLALLNSTEMQSYISYKFKDKSQLNLRETIRFLRQLPIRFPDKTTYQNWQDAIERFTLPTENVNLLKESIAIYTHKWYENEEDIAEE